MSKKTLTVVICTYNSEDRLRETIRAICASELQGVEEIILVDNNSTDNTRQVFEELTKEIPVRSRAITETRQGLAYARARGVLTSISDVICFLDDDNAISTDWFSRIQVAFSRDDKIGAVGGQILPPTNVALPAWFESVSANYAVGRQAINSQYVTRPRMLLWGAGLAVRRDLAAQFYSHLDDIVLVGRTGSKLLAGDDTELCYYVVSQGYELYYDEELILTHNFDPKRLTRNYVMKVNIGFGRARYHLFHYHVMLKKGRLHRYRPLHTKTGRFLVGLVDLLRQCSLAAVHPNTKRICQIANCWGYILEAFKGLALGKR